MREGMYCLHLYVETSSILTENFETKEAETTPLMNDLGFDRMCMRQRIQGEKCELQQQHQRQTDTNTNTTNSE